MGYRLLAPFLVGALLISSGCEPESGDSQLDDYVPRSELEQHKDEAIATMTSLTDRVENHEARLQSLKRRVDAIGSRGSSAPVAGQPATRQIPVRLVGLNPNPPEPQPLGAAGQQGVTLTLPDGRQFQCPPVAAAPAGVAPGQPSPGLRDWLKERFGESESRQTEMITRQQSAQQQMAANHQVIMKKLGQITETLQQISEKLDPPAAAAD